MTTPYRQAQERLEREAREALGKAYPEHAVTAVRFSLASTATRKVGVLVQVELPEEADDWPPVIEETD